MGGRFDRPRHSRREPGTHTTEHQAIYIEGYLEFEVGGEGGLRFAAGAGSYIIEPKGLSHCF